MVWAYTSHSVFWQANDGKERERVNGVREQDRSKVFYATGSYLNAIRLRQDTKSLVLGAWLVRFVMERPVTLWDQPPSFPLSSVSIPFLWSGRNGRALDPALQHFGPVVSVRNKRRLCQQ